MSLPEREARPKALQSFGSVISDASEASGLAQEMYWEGASQGPDCVLEGYFGHDRATRLAQLAILQEHYASEFGGAIDPEVIHKASSILLRLWGIKEMEG